MTINRPQPPEFIHGNSICAECGEFPYVIVRFDQRGESQYLCEKCFALMRKMVDELSDRLMIQHYNNRIAVAIEDHHRTKA